MSKKYRLVFENNRSDFPYLPTILPKKERVIVIGDLHGDYKLTIDCLKIANVIDNNYDDPNWIGKSTVVVQIGDQIDRCRPINFDFRCDNPRTTQNDEQSVIRIMELFNKLHEHFVR